MSDQVTQHGQIQGATSFYVLLKSPSFFDSINDQVIKRAVKRKHFANNFHTHSILTSLEGGERVFHTLLLANTILMRLEEHSHCFMYGLASKQCLEDFLASPSGHLGYRARFVKACAEINHISYGTGMIQILTTVRPVTFTEEWRSLRIYIASKSVLHTLYDVKKCLTHPLHRQKVFCTRFRGL